MAVVLVVVPAVRVSEVMLVVPVLEVVPAGLALVLAGHHVVEAIDTLVQFPFCVALVHILPTASVARPNRDRGPMEQLAAPRVVAPGRAAMAVAFECSVTQ